MDLGMLDLSWRGEDMWLRYFLLATSLAVNVVSGFVQQSPAASDAIAGLRTDWAKRLA